MSVTREHTVWCDAPDCVEWVTFSGSASIVRREARSLGWRFAGRKKDLCPKHAREAAPVSVDQGVDDCAWCGAEIKLRRAPGSVRGEVFCCRAHRDASARAVRRLHERVESATAEKKT